MIYNKCKTCGASPAGSLINDECEKCYKPATNRTKKEIHQERHYQLMRREELLGFASDLKCNDPRRDELEQKAHDCAVIASALLWLEENAERRLRHAEGTTEKL
jgi:hypothetical protein